MASHDASLQEEPSILPGAAQDEFETFAGDGDRIVKVAFVEVRVYNVALYLNLPAAAEALEDFAGHSHEELCSNTDFFECFMAARFLKVLRITFLHKIPKARVQAGFTGALCSRLGSEFTKDVGAFAGLLADVTEQDTLTLRLEADGKTMRINASWQENDAILQTPEMWLAIQQIYFDARTEMPNVRRGAIRLLPQLLHSTPAGRKMSISASSTSTFDPPLAGKPSWKAFAKRPGGKEGYRFGDLTRGLIAKSKNRRHSEAEDEKQPQGVQSEQEMIYLQEIMQLRAEVDENLRAAEVQKWAFFTHGNLVGAASATLAALLLDATASPALQQIGGLTILAGLAGGGFLAYRQHLQRAGQ